MKLLLSSKQIPVTGSTLAQIWKNHLTKSYLTARELPNYELALAEYERLSKRAKQHSTGKLIIPIGNSLYEGARVSRSYVYLHRYLMEVAAGCYLPRQVKVSLANGDPLNVHPDNLVLHRTTNIRCKYETVRASCSSCGSELPYRHRNKNCTYCGIKKAMGMNYQIKLTDNETLKRKIKEVSEMFLDKIDQAIAYGATNELLAYGFTPRNFVLVMAAEELAQIALFEQKEHGLDHASSYSSYPTFAYGQGIANVLDEAERKVVAAATTTQNVVLS